MQIDNKVFSYEKLGIPAEGYVCDVTDEAAVGALVHQIEEKNGGIKWGGK